jgi:enoyl-CoA hydratase
VEGYSQGHREWLMTDYYHRCLWDNPKPIIGSVHGFCLAGFCNMLAHCDIIIAADNAIFGYPPVRWGNAGAPQTFWPHYVGLRKAKELALTGNFMSAQEAYNFHWVNKVVPLEKLEEETDKFSRAMASLPLNTLVIAKRSINNFYESMGLKSQLDYVEALKAFAFTYPGTEVGSPHWRSTRPKEIGLSAFLRERDAAFVEVDRWWRERHAARPKFERGTKEELYKKKE